VHELKMIRIVSLSQCGSFSIHAPEAIHLMTTSKPCHCVHKYYKWSDCWYIAKSVCNVR